MTTKGSTHSGEVEPADEAFWGFDPILSVQQTSKYMSEKEQPRCITGPHKGGTGDDPGIKATSERCLTPKLLETGEEKRHPSLGLGTSLVKRCTLGEENIQRQES